MHIDAASSVFKLRQVERVARGSVFGLELIYDVLDPNDAAADFALLAEGFRLLEADSLGGHGTRGYGKVTFGTLSVELVVGKLHPKTLSACRRALESVC